MFELITMCRYSVNRTHMYSKYDSTPLFSFRKTLLCMSKTLGHTESVLSATTELENSVLPGSVRLWGKIVQFQLDFTSFVGKIRLLLTVPLDQRATSRVSTRQFRVEIPPVVRWPVTGPTSHRNPQHDNFHWTNEPQVASQREILHHSFGCIV